MAFWKQISDSGIFKIIRDTGSSYKTITLAGQTLLDRQKTLLEQSITETRFAIMMRKQEEG